MTITTSCSYSGGPYQWSAMDLAAADRRLAGYGRTEEEAIADLKRLLGEKAEAAEQDAAMTATDVVNMVADDARLLESLMDKRGLDWLLETVSSICSGKGVHIAEHWQDTALAKRWAGIGMLVGVIAPKAKGL
jgi:hypothetical protein